MNHCSREIDSHCIFQFQSFAIDIVDNKLLYFGERIINDVSDYNKNILYKFELEIVITFIREVYIFCFSKYRNRRKRIKGPENYGF